MAKLNRLIKGQDVAFDTHQAGDGQSIHWQDLHLEKRLHGRRGKLKFPLFGGQQPSKPRNMSNDDYKAIVSEVKKALKGNNDLVSDLAETIVDVIKRFSNNSATLEHAIEAANKLAESFNLGKRFSDEIHTRFGSISNYTSLHIDPRDHLIYEISQSKEGVTIETPKFYPKKKRRLI